MISLVCTNCQAVLTIDDAFAGGVCRCQHCGTIQTVPALKSASAGAPRGAAAGSKALYQKQGPSRADGATATGSGTGLDELADVVASSGLAGSGLSSQKVSSKSAPKAVPATQVRNAPPQERRKNPLFLIMLLACGLLVTILLLVIAVLVFRNNSSVPTAGGTGISTAVVPSVAEGPSFCGVPLTESSVIYILDRGNSTQPVFDPLKAACYRSMELLGPDRQFQVILTDNGAGLAAYPRSSMTFATASQIESAKRDLQDVVADGSSHLRSAFTEALSHKPAVIVLATGKSSLETDDEAVLHEARGQGIRIHTFALGEAAGAPALDEVAKTTGGESRHVSAPELRSFSR